MLSIKIALGTHLLNVVIIAFALGTKSPGLEVMVVSALGTISKYSNGEGVDLPGQISRCSNGGVSWDNLPSVMVVLTHTGDQSDVLVLMVVSLLGQSPGCSNGDVALLGQISQCSNNWVSLLD
ncbi:hypothetical protein AVEN_144786-1 [Araneus ventricosus]|uniref:Uncharacterized protein n=1 Tax=Araneus ventricosus TaxID=182803 RepID=A0A4Y2LCN9_ARAVE|nr:hypothetical protein AVEN_144786-1 [Araneus ventricosus]